MIEANLAEQAVELDATFLDALAAQRKKLVEVGGRNPLTNTPLQRTRSKYLRIVDELSDQVFRHLVVEVKEFTFLPGEESKYQDDEEVGYVPDEALDGVKATHTDSHLQTTFTPEELHRKLRTLDRDASKFEEEAGMSVLYLALGFLEYSDASSSSKSRFAPLLLIPVELIREGVKSQYSLAMRDNEIESNRSLLTLLKSDYDILLENFDSSGVTQPSAYFEQIRRAVDRQSTWQVHTNYMALGPYSFGKDRMYRDLEDQTVDSAGNPELLQTLLVGEGRSDAPRVSIDAPEQKPDSSFKNLDEKYRDLKQLGHVLDADSAQTRVIAQVADGKSVVVQGPPGTGKSQTIANIIAVAVHQRKSVLFVAEKRAALEVVHRRLVNTGLGPICLELHSHKSGKREVYDELRRTLELNEPLEVVTDHYRETQQTRDDLNRTSELLHTVDIQTGETPFLLMGRVSSLVGKGTKLPDFEIDGIDRWSKTDFEKRRQLVRALADQTKSYGSEATHLWRGATKRLNVADSARLVSLLSSAISRIQELEISASEIFSSCSLTSPLTLANCRPLAKLLELFARAPMDIEKLLAWEHVQEHIGSLTELCDQISSIQTLRNDLSERVVDQAFDSAWETAVNDYERYKSSLFRIFNGRYRRACLALADASKGKVKASERQTLFEQLVTYEAKKKEISTQEAIGNSYFNLSWRTELTDVATTVETAKWVQQATALTKDLEELQSIRSFRANWDEADQMYEAFNEKSTSIDGLLKQIEVVLGLDWLTVFDGNEPTSIAVSDLKSRLEQWHSSSDTLNEYFGLKTVADQVSAMGIEEVRSRIASGGLVPADAEDSFTLLRAEKTLDRLMAEEPELSKLDGSQRTAKVEKFIELDLELQKLAAQEIARHHYLNIPRGQTGQLALIRGEINKKNRHLSIRRLLAEAGEAISQIKPVFLMSPVSVAQYLEANGITFDVLVMDEASQIKPEDALGSIMRCKQVVVVGDQKQMPPTNFFNKMTSDDDDFDDEEFDIASQSADMESILSLFDARMPTREMLRWHYRSEHPSLIEVSNHEFYENKLQFPPSPHVAKDSYGMNFMKADGVYQRGKGKSNNPGEAQAICEAVLDHARTYPERTLGVVGLSSSQANLIANKMEIMRSEHPELESFCNGHPEEPFFVKNLENVQGDERDAILVSIGYGRDSKGNFFQNFGPVSSPGGERRLNVLFTRARKRCTIFASITHDDIRADAAKNIGPVVLKRFLKFAATGNLDIPLVTGEEMDSPFEEDVASVITSYGYVVEAQVGSSGFKIDLAIRDTSKADRYLLAVECDGARYHSSAWARERDRMRQSVLEGKGWRFHRIWSTDWFYNREVEIRKLIDAIEVAKGLADVDDGVEASGSSLAQRTSEEEAESTSTPVEEGATVTHTQSPNQVESSDSQEEKPFDGVIKRSSTPAEHKVTDLVIQPYAVADFAIPAAEQAGILDFTPYELTDYIKDIVRIEGPVHNEILTRRLNLLWGNKGLGKRNRSLIEEAIELAVSNEWIKQVRDSVGQFYELPKGTKYVVRDRSGLKTAIEKDCSNVPDVEFGLALKDTVAQSFSIEPEEAIKYVSSQLGWRRLTLKVRNRISEVIHRMVIRGELEKRDGKLRIGEHSSVGSSNTGSTPLSP